jgi:blue copper oxidase
MALSRRKLLLVSAATAFGAGVLATTTRKDPTALKQISNEFYSYLPIPKLIDAREVGNRISLNAQVGETEFFPNFKTESYGYSAPYLGPVVRLYRGDTVTMDVTNQLSKVTTVHWHGLLVPSEFDGGPYNSIDSGQSWQPTFKIDQSASTAWFHPHPHGDTARQAYMGLAGLIYIEDEISKDLGLPGRYGLDDIPLIIQDRKFSADGELIYDPAAMDVLHGFRGDTIIVNGIYGPVAEVPKGIVRLRILNGANARNFRLAFDDRRSMHVIANDNGFISAPAEVKELTIAPGERYEILVDFTNGESTVLLTYPDQNGRPSNGIADQLNEVTKDLADIFTPVMRFDPVLDISVVTNTIPLKLVSLPTPIVPPGAKRRTFILDSMTAINVPLSQEANAMEGMDHSTMSNPMTLTSDAATATSMRMGINGKTFDVMRIDAEVKLGDREIWELRGTEMAHPFHIHGATFRILNLDGNPPPAYQAGNKDTVLVNEWAQLLVSFDQRGDASKPFMFHCHILEHEDAGMMAQYSTI